MFDPETSSLLRSAPELQGLDPNNIPQILTSNYARLVSMRLRGAAEEENVAGSKEWPLDRIADSYELITSVHSDPTIRRASAFVAATAQQILSRKQNYLEADVEATLNITRDSIDPSLSAALLFLTAGQYADANETASAIKIKRQEQLYEATILSEHIYDLARGQLSYILERGKRWRSKRNRIEDLETLAFITLLDSLITGVEMLAAQVLAIPISDEIAERFENAHQAFSTVLSFSSKISDIHFDEIGGPLTISYPGPRHMAALLISAHDGIFDAALTNVVAPLGADPDFWKKWISFRANKFPYVWPNHREAINQGFHENGISSVLVLPTGAGKTTVSSLKIAGVLAQGKKVVFLAPTHALVDQLTNDLQEMFPQNILGAVVSSDFDLLMKVGARLPEIEVMTPERCLAMLSFAAESFEDVGLLVFDECHLLSPESGKIRRALDSMLCVLAFNKIAPTADMLFLSAMLKNGKEFALWIKDLTRRDCISVDLLWKPSRQARGVVIFEETELEQIKRTAIETQTRLDQEVGKNAKGLRTDAERELRAQPYAIWGLQHNWLNREQNKAVCIFTKIAEEKVPLNGEIKYGRINLKPNANTVAAKLAAISAKKNLKTIVFVNQKSHAVSTARVIAEELGQQVLATEEEQERWDALTEELGGLKHSILDGPSSAVPHNASMLWLERNLAERMYRRSDGAKVIVATPTLAQGLNLPAQLAIIAGDKRANSEQGGRESLEAHEILNAAARAGRAGHLANGIVLLVPEPILHFPQNESLNGDVVKKLQSILPEDDRCVTISDPLEVVLDRISSGDLLNRDVLYMINRMTSLKGVDEDPSVLFNLKRSFAAFVAVRNAKESEFKVKLEILRGIVVAESVDEADTTLAILASQSGLPPNILARLKEKINQEIGALPVSVEGWVSWTLNWLQNDNEARAVLLYDVQGSVCAATGRKKAAELGADEVADLVPGINSWIKGLPLRDVEISLGGDPDSTTNNARVCIRARELISSVIPRGLSFIMGLVTHVAKEINPYDAQEELSKDLVEILGTAVRLGFDTPEKALFAINNPRILSRVQAHNAFNNTNKV